LSSARGTSWRSWSGNEFDERIYATPAVVDDTLYVRTTGHLYAIAHPSGKAGDAGR